MKRLGITILLLCSLMPVAALAQDNAGREPLIPAAKKVYEAYTMMKAHPGDPLYEIQYLLAFPHDYLTFEKVFDAEYEAGHQLYDVELDYIYYAMPDLSKRHPELVGIDLMGLGGQSDYAFPDIGEIAGSLQHTLIEYGVGHPNLFIQLFNQLSEEQKKRVMTMLANVESFKGYSYDTLTEKLESAGSKDIADRLKQAKIDRIKQGH